MIILGSKDWDTGITFEQVHQPCVCGLCHKQIGKSTLRITISVNAVWNEGTHYQKWYHSTCLLNKLKDGAKQIGMEIIVKELDKIKKMYAVINDKEVKNK